MTNPTLLQYIEKMGKAKPDEPLMDVTIADVKLYAANQVDPTLAELRAVVDKPPKTRDPKKLAARAVKRAIGMAAGNENLYCILKKQ